MFLDTQKINIMKLVVIISILVVVFTSSYVSSESWRETYHTPDGYCGTVFDYVLNVPQTASAYASVKKVPEKTGTRVYTYGSVFCEYYRNKEKTEISRGNWTLDIWYSNDHKSYWILQIRFVFVIG